MYVIGLNVDGIFKNEVIFILVVFENFFYWQDLLVFVEEKGYYYLWVDFCCFFIQEEISSKGFFFQVFRFIKVDGEVIFIGFILYGELVVVGQVFCIKVGKFVKIQVFGFCFQFDFVLEFGVLINVKFVFFCYFIFIYSYYWVFVVRLFV